MKILKGTKLRVTHRRQGTFLAIADKDFDIDDEWYPVILDQDYLQGLSTYWCKGECVPCRKGLVEVFVLGDEE